MIATNAVSLAEYAVAPNAWTGAVSADDTEVGHVLVLDDPDARQCFLWRFMIDRRFQGMGFGPRAVDLAVGYVRARPGAKGLATSCVPIAGGPGPFYHALRFVDTGEEEEGKLVTLLAL